MLTAVAGSSTIKRATVLLHGLSFNLVTFVNVSRINFGSSFRATADADYVFATCL